MQHALDCKLGGLRVIQHNEVRDVLAQCMREAGHSLVEVEPQVQELSGEVFEFKLLTRMQMRAAISSAVGFGATSDRRFSI